MRRNDLNEPSYRGAYSIDLFFATFCIGRTKTYEEISAGRLKVAKIGRRTVIPAADAYAWLESCRNPEGGEVVMGKNKNLSDDEAIELEDCFDAYPPEEDSKSVFPWSWCWDRWRRLRLVPSRRAGEDR